MVDCPWLDSKLDFIKVIEGFGGLDVFRILFGSSSHNASRQKLVFESSEVGCRAVFVNLAPRESNLGAQDIGKSSACSCDGYSDR